jgi:acyl-CoA synthetase (AMP-forming)/AMP-acid ligase II
MVCDRLGYMTFCDRVGDTFRWRGENVATVEIEDIVGRAFRALECVVYGVEVPGQEGRCGMMAIHLTNTHG